MKLASVGGDAGTYTDNQCCILIQCQRSVIQLSTGYQMLVDKILQGVYTYAQVRSYIRLEFVDKY